MSTITAITGIITGLQALYRLSATGTGHHEPELELGHLRHLVGHVLCPVSRPRPQSKMRSCWEGECLQKT